MNQLTDTTLLPTLQPAAATSLKPALRLASTLGLAPDDWQALRRTGIGSSDAAAAVGLSPYKSPLELWLEKTGRADGLAQPDANDTTHPVYWGARLEPLVAITYTRRTGRRVRRVNAVLQHPGYRFMLANVDREVIGAADVQLLECKTAGEYGARRWQDGVPEDVELQVQHQLAVTGKQAADVAVLLYGQRLEIHRVERDELLIARLIELEARFWEHVVTDTPPPADGSESADRALRHLYPGTTSEHTATVDLTEDTELSTAFTQLVALKARIKADEGAAERHRQAIQQAMGEAGEARFEGGRVTFRRSKDGAGIDTTRLLAEHPEMARQYAVTKPGSRRFRVCESD